MKRSEFFKSLAVLVVAPLAITKAVAGNKKTHNIKLGLGDRAVTFRKTIEVKKMDLLLADTGDIGYVIGVTPNEFTVVNVTDRKQYFRYNKTFKVFQDAFKR